MIQKINLEECDANIQKFVESFEKTDPVVFYKSGKPQYILGGIDNFEWEVLSLSQNHAFMNYLEQARQRGKREGTMSIGEVRKRLEIPSDS